MTLIGMDLNATRARAVSGPRSQATAAIRLEGESFEMPVALSLEGRHPVVGRAGAALSRRLPHLACLDFLPHLGDGRAWSAGAHRLDADRALGRVLDALRPTFGTAHGVALALPAYLTEPQIRLVLKAADQSRWPLLGSLPAPLAAVLAARAEGSLPGQGPVIVFDLDGHALTMAAVEVTDGRVRLLQVHAAAHLGRGAWLRRLLDGAADRFVRLSRRDPRESADAEQALYDQLGQVLANGVGRSLTELTVKSGAWFQQLMLHPDEITGFVAPHLWQTVAEIEAFLAAALPPGTAPLGILLTHAAGHLPGLAAFLEQRFQLPAGRRDGTGRDGSDFGEDLLETLGSRVGMLAPESVARAAHEFAVRVHRGDLPSGHLEAIALPDGPDQAEIEAGPPRLHFRGRDHLLVGPTFTLGRDPACDLVFESELYPTVSAHHCEIRFDRRAYTLCDRSRHGTLLNDRPLRQPTELHGGDCIRLGPTGPVVRFLGETADRPSLQRQA
jgi:hypothetical protein